MRPVLPTNNTVDGLSTNLKRTRDLFLAHAFVMQSTNRSHSIWRQFLSSTTTCFWVIRCAAFDMFPCGAGQNTSDTVARNTKALGHFLDPNGSGKCAHFTDNGRCHPCVPLDFTMRHSSFAHCILHIIFWCAQEQVSGIHTGAYVTMMTDQQISLNWPNTQFVGNTMNSSILPRSCQFNNSIANCIDMSRPQPAGRCLVDLFPKAFFKGYYVSAC